MSLDPSGVSRSVADIDEARVLGGEVYYPHRVGMVRPSDKFCMHLDVRTFGPLTVGRLRYDSEVLIRTGPLTDGYQFNIPFGGALRTTYGDEQVLATSGLAAVHSPHRPTSITGWGDSLIEMLAVKITRSAVEETLERLLGHQLRDPVEMSASLAIDRGRGAEVWRLLRVLADQLHDAHAGGSGESVGGSLFDTSPFAASLAQSVVTGLLYAQDHNYSHELHTPIGTGGPAAIKSAIAYVQDHAGEPIGVNDVADHVGLCVRSLQEGFAKHVGATPTAYLRQVRLCRIREVLLLSDPSETSVATVAASWGFFHLGRFAGQYREAYGEPPSATLRRTATA